MRAITIPFHQQIAQPRGTETKQPRQVVSATMQVCETFGFTYDRTRIASHPAFEICGYVGEPSRESLRDLLRLRHKVSGLGVRRCSKCGEYLPGASVFSIRRVEIVKSRS